ncbi:MAG: TRAP transporter large permease [Candidatus Competibacterales bacterium]
MDSLILAGLLFAFLLVLLATGLWVGIALILVGFCAIAFFSPAPAGSLLASTVWDNSWNWALTALPLFIWMGEILFRSRLSEDMFKGLAPWLTWLPGRLLHVNIVGCGVMAAVAGSSAVTCATVGKISMPELQRRGYDESMAIGTLAGSGTLGLLIPPSIMLIVYGVVAQQSIARMFIAGILPGLLLVGLFMGYVMLWSCLRPSRVPASDITMSFGAMVWGLRRLFPVVALIALVLGSIYGGYATPTEAATLGVLGALALAFGAGALTWRTFHDSLLGAVKTSCMITLIIAGASFLAVAMGFTGIPRAIADGVASLGLSPAMLLVVLTVLFVILGWFLDGVW